MGRLRQSARPLDRGGRRRTVQSVHNARLSPCARNLRLGRRPHGLDAGACGRRGRARAHGRRRALLSQKPQPGRICVRPCVGGRLLSAPAGAIIRNSRSPPRSRRSPGGGSWSRRTRRRRARRADRVFARIAQADQGVIDSRNIPDGGGRRTAREGGFSHPHRRAVPFFVRGLCMFRGFPRGARVPQAQGDQTRAARRAGWRRHDRMGHRRINQIRALGRLLQILHAHGLTQMGPPLSDPRLLRPDRRDTRRPRPSGDGAAAGRYIAGAINFIGDDALYGRNWGAVEDRPFLHFEVCYYQAIDFALARGLRRIEAGAQGEHKLARGYRPVAHLLGARVRRRRVSQERSPTISDTSGSPSRARSLTTRDTLRSARAKTTLRSRTLGKIL